MRLETDRLLLREWKEEDAADLHEGLNNLNISRWLAFVPYPYTEKNAADWIDYCIQLSKTHDKDSYEYAVELKAAGKIIGGVTLNKINISQGTAGGGVWINEDYHGQGYGSEAYGERIRFAFEELKLRRLENGYLDGNHSSFAMQRKFGYKREGLRRKAFRSLADGKFKDEHITALLREDWVKVECRSVSECDAS